MKKFVLTTIACTALISFSPLGDQTEVKAATSSNIASAQVKTLQVSPPATVDEIFPDDALAFKVAQKLGVSENTIVTQEQLDTITEMVYVAFEVEDLTGMEYLHNLNTLDLSQNNISTLDSLANLTQLEFLSLNSNKITDITSLMNLPQLKNLEIGANQITSLPSFENLTNLKILNLSSNQLSDISALKDAQYLTNLSVSNNHIADISVISNLSQLQLFYGESNQITSIEAFRNNKTLVDFDANFNQITDITPLSNIPTLRSVYIDENQISDFSSLEGQLLTSFEATGQNIYLPSVTFGESTDIVIKDNKGVTLNDWVWYTPGSYENDILTWKDTGDNSAYFLNNVYPEFPSVSVTVYQTVTPN
ncbi:leucine-rich repeat domain-containing protein [Listeria ivanovii]|uniref:leucine-rich repeat domain-containing protein n=1 Tax=Listeria ivanovii TaxID=1638 RepID=UPI0019445A3F|nr:leucine-rich repeat domain-containing protein [Listeria ivanovii]MBM5720732.1 leucine-rich repeat domain-containing protein [Listeria ivanovii]